jgi:prepilin-type N-terminal cleavage/methylation domain-containing protein
MQVNKAMTLLELIVVLIIVGILSTIGIVSYQGAVRGAHDRQAQSSLLLIAQAEETRFLEMRNFAACGNTAACNAALHLNLPANNWRYVVTGIVIDPNNPAPPNTTFVVRATPVAGSDAANVNVHCYDIHRGNATAACNAALGANCRSCAQP